MAGWVTNRPDGTVEAVFEGTAEAVEAWSLRPRGPGNASGSELEVTEEEPEGLTGFRVT